MKGKKIRFTDRLWIKINIKKIKIASRFSKWIKINKKWIKINENLNFFLIFFIHFIQILDKRNTGGIDVKKPPLLQIGDKQGGFLIKWPDPKNDHKKIGEKHDFLAFQNI